MNYRVALFGMAVLIAAASPSLHAKETIAGDLDFYERITAREVVTVLRASLGLVKLEESARSIADVAPSPGVDSRAGYRYGDGQINLSDATRMLRAAVGLEPLERNWYPPTIHWTGHYLVMDSGDALQPGGVVRMGFSWEGPGAPSWTTEPSGSATIWRLKDERSALLEANPSSEANNFTVKANVAPYEATYWGAVRNFEQSAAVTLTVTTNKVDYPPLESPQITVTARNNLKAGATTGAGVMLLVFDNETQQQIWEARDPQWDQKVELKPGETRTWTFAWDWKGLDGFFVQPRPYTIFAQLGGSDSFTFFSKGTVITRVAVN